MLKWWWSTILSDVSGDDSKFDHELLQKYPQAATIMDSCFLTSLVSWWQMQPLSPLLKKAWPLFLTPRERPEAPWILRNQFCRFFYRKNPSRLNSVERLMSGNSPPSFRKKTSSPNPRKTKVPKKKRSFFGQQNILFRNVTRSGRIGDIESPEKLTPATWTLLDRRDTILRLGVCAPKWWFRIRESPPKMPEPFR